MSPFIKYFTITVAVFAAGVLQGETLHLNGVSVKDAIYNQFASMIQFQEQVAQAKLNFIVSWLETVLGSAPTDPVIQTNLTYCYEYAASQYPSADPDCMEDVSMAVNETIYDSQQQLAFCANLTHGWLVAKGLLPGAYAANTSLVDVVTQILAGALKCAKRFAKNPTKEYNCMVQVQQQYSDDWKNATNVINTAYDELSGVGLITRLGISDCLILEEDTLQDKCDEITADVESCATNTTRHHF
uniref:Protein TsetseEP domain-containing protein n=1 Tax=Cuerna arida TaxID=1464854 RepID=A0A1B6GX68_9HEMI